MDDATTTHTGPLGSTIHCLRADAETVTALAAVDWNRWFPRVTLDPVLGLITLMTPSRLHENLAEILLHVVDTAGSAVTGASKGLLSTRLRGPAEPPGTGMEPDCAFYVGERARGLPGGAHRRRGGGGCLPGTGSTRSGGGGGDHQRRRGKDWALRRAGRARAMAAARPKGDPRSAGRLPRASSRNGPAPNSRLGRPRRSYVRRRLRGGGRRAVQHDCTGANRRSRSCRAPPAAIQRAGARGGSLLRDRPRLTRASRSGRARVPSVASGQRARITKNS